ncbi:hypothetical protein [Cerasicoccus frondis]|uniref:hypothetical protein n=1 Tax=Cerasicoccus frondis TaxID=490090 RepID=UPI002852B2BF|nr:hypothetical protein [Cerasicoccus frondis]
MNSHLSLCGACWFVLASPAVIGARDTIDPSAAANMTADLAADDVVIDTPPINADYGGSASGDSITVDTKLFYDSPHHLYVPTEVDFAIQGKIRKENALSGDRGIVAGWDTLTAFGLPTYLAEDLAAPGLFGNFETAGIRIGGAQSAAVAVGSRMGTTGLFGDEVNLADLSINDSSNAGRFNQSGHIDAQALANNNIFNGLGDVNFNFSLIGHGGRGTSGDLTSILGEISVPLSIGMPPLSDYDGVSGEDYEYRTFRIGSDFEPDAPVIIWAEANAAFE